MTNIRELSNGIAELSEASLLMGGVPTLKEDGSVMWCFPPRVKLPASFSEKDIEHLAEIGGFSVSGNTTEGELRQLYTRMVGRTSAFINSGRYGVDLKEYASKISTFKRDKNLVSDMPGVDFAKAMKEYISMIPEGEVKDSHMKLVLNAYEQLKNLYDNNYIDENLKRAMNSVLKNIESNNDFLEYFVKEK